MNDKHNFFRHTITLLLLALSIHAGVAANHLCFTAEEAGSKVWCEFYVNTWGSEEEELFPDINYSTDEGTTWNTMHINDSITLENVGDKVYFKGVNPNGLSQSEGSQRRLHNVNFGMSGRIAASGSVMSLIDGEGISTKIPQESCFYNLFSRCSALTQAPELPATTLTRDCYNGMFSGCTNLTKAPDLPATELEPRCYQSMFLDCKNLKEAPEIAATTVAESSCYNMFSDCESLEKAPDLNAKQMEKYCYQGMFRNCTSLTEAPNLPATRLDKYCYSDMFSGCIKLRTAGELPAKRLDTACYQNMFNECRALTSISGISAEKVAPYSCFNMFNGCESLSEAPTLHATKMEDRCYFGMFRNCKGLRSALELPATELAEHCYEEMFMYCNNLRIAPELPATELKSYCYSFMFKGCVYLNEAPYLPATELVDHCYYYMLNSCSRLNYISVGVMSLENSFEATTEWVDGVDGNKGLFVFPCGSTYNVRGASDVPMNFRYISSPVYIFQNPDSTELWRDTVACGEKPEYKGEEPTYGEGLVFKRWDKKLDAHTTPDIYYYTAIYEEKDEPAPGNWLRFTAREEGSEVWYENEEGNTPDVQYSLDEGQTWQPLLQGERVTLENVGDKVYFKGNNPKGFSCIKDQETGAVTGHTKFRMTGRISASGSVMSLIDETGESLTIPGDKCFQQLFQECASLTKAPNLPATTLTSGCYQGMFEKCTGLTYTPELPATTLATDCYHSMFSGCGNLMVAEDLPATTLTDGCYAEMFMDCAKLTIIPELTATTMKRACYSGMFAGCGNMLQAPELPSQTLDEACYANMFANCIGLKKAPELSATTLKEMCYSSMFEGCENLTEAPELPATELADRCYTSMFRRCSSLTDAPELPATTLTSACYTSMFDSCVSLVKAPELSAASLTSDCYSEMFRNCHNLNYIKVGVTSLDNDQNATTNWVDGVEGPGDFIFPCGSKYNKHGASEVPTNFTIIASPIVVFQNPDYTELWRDTIGCGAIPEYKGDTPTLNYRYDFSGWDKELTALNEIGTYYYTAEYTKKEFSATSKWLCFTAERAGSTFMYESIGTDPDMQYSMDGGETWRPLMSRTEIIMEEEGDKVFLKGYNPEGLSYMENHLINNYRMVRFDMRGKIAASGNIMSLIDGEGETTKIPNRSCFESLFDGCISLTQAPELPATTLTDYCYEYMFANCINLKEAPELPATTLSSGCYNSMFSGCENLEEAPALPADSLGDACYRSMFEYCYNLKKAPVLAATQTENFCYSSMFHNCTSLEEAPQLPARNLSIGCYESMFTECTSLKEAPELPATTLEEYCYENMFAYCTSLKEAPELPASELKHGCYENMFNHCSNLNYIKVGVMSLDNDSDATTNWVTEVDGPGTFIFPCGSTYDKHGESEVPTLFEILRDEPIIVFQNPDSTILRRDTIVCGTHPEYIGETPTWNDGYTFKGWDKDLNAQPSPGTNYYTALYEKEETPEPSNWLCFTAEKENSVLWIESDAENIPDIQYSLDGGETWKAWSANEKLTMENVGDKVYLRGYNPHGFSSVRNPEAEEENTGTVRFYMTGRIAASGSVMSLIDGEGKTTVIPNTKCFQSLFHGCGALTKAPELPATELTPKCYSSMFTGCTNLEIAPDLPATTLAKECYSDMFYFCRSLKQIATMSATTMDDHSCWNMYKDCTSLEEITNFPASTMAYRCCYDMFAGCTKLTRVSELPSMDLAEECYMSIFAGCTSLTQAPVLPATQLADGCYDSMFHGCTSLVESPELPTTTLAISCYSYMFHNCTSLTKAPELPADIAMDHCYSGMFAGCTSLTQAPVLPATQLRTGCYSNMFMDCTNLEEAPKLPVTTVDAVSYSGMFQNCTRLTEAPELPATSISTGSYAGMFKGCTGITKAPELMAVPAKDLPYACYREMFYGCTNLEYIKVGVMSLDVDSLYSTPSLERTINDATEDWVKGVDKPGIFIFPCGSTYDKRGVSQVPPHFKIVKETPIVVFQNPDSTVLRRDTINCGDTPKYRGATPTMGEGYSFKGWDKDLSTVESSGVYYITALYDYEDPELTKKLQLAVDDKLILVLPGGSETVGYELTGGEGSKYEVRYQDRIICSGDVTNDSTVSLTCPKDLEPDAYNATLVMYDEEGNFAKRAFTFNVMLPDNKQRSYYVRVWNDVVICRNEEGRFLSFQWYKERQKQERDSLQYLTDISILDGEYMVHVHDKDGRNYFIEPIHYEPVEAAYAITATPNVTERNVDFTVTISGVEPDDLKKARIVVYRADGVIEKVIDEVEMESTMHLKSGEYVIVLTVNDGKNANCKVLVK